MIKLLLFAKDKVESLISGGSSGFAIGRCFVLLPASKDFNLVYSLCENYKFFAHLCDQHIIYYEKALHSFPWDNLLFCQFCNQGYKLYRNLS